jgi:hypothetical protein
MQMDVAPNVKSANKLENASRQPNLDRTLTERGNVPILSINDSISRLIVNSAIEKAAGITRTIESNVRRQWHSGEL